MNRFVENLDETASAKVAVCMPISHTATSDPPRAILSVIGQTFRDWQLVCVVDRCAKRDCLACDAIAEEIRGFNDHRIMVFEQFRHELGDMGSDQGASARNLALQSSISIYCAYLDDDNWWEPEHLESCVYALEKTHASLVFSGSKIRTPGGKLLYEKSVHRPCHCGIDVSELAHRRDVLKYGYWPTGWNRKYGMDCDWIMVERLLKAGELEVSTGCATVNYTTSRPFIYTACLLKHGILPRVL